MPRLQLETATDVLSLDEQVDVGKGVQVHAGVTGLGLPPVSTQWSEGAGDGATFRGRRALPRDIDLPLTILSDNRESLKATASRLALALSKECTLRLKEEDGTSWFTKVHRVGGGEYTYGVDTDGETELSMVVTMRSGDPYWTAEQALQARIGESVAEGFLPQLVHMNVSSSQAIGSVTLENSGDADAYPTWVVYGPGDNFRAVSPAGDVLHWTGTLNAGQVLTIDTKNGSVRDHDGVNRYSELAASPRLWRVPPGLSVAEASFQNTTGDSRIEVTWRPRRWMVI